MLGMFGAWGLSAGLGLDPLLGHRADRARDVRLRHARLPPPHAPRAGRAIRSRRSSRPSACSSCCRTRVVAGFTSDYRFVERQLPGAARAAPSSPCCGITFGVPLLLAAGLALVLFLALYLLDRAHGVRPGAAGHQRGPRRGAAGGHPAPAHVRGGLGPGRRARRDRRRHPRQLLLRLPAGRACSSPCSPTPSSPSAASAASSARCSPRSSSGVIQSVTVVVPAAGVQGRVRLRVVSPDRAVPAAGPVRAVLVAATVRAGARAGVGAPHGSPVAVAAPSRRSSPPSPRGLGGPIVGGSLAGCATATTARHEVRPADARPAAPSPRGHDCEPIARDRAMQRARPTTRRSASWCCSTRCSAWAGTSSAGGRGSSTSGRRCSSRWARTRPRCCT